MTDTPLTENALAKVPDETLIEEYEGRAPPLDLGPEWDEDAYRALVIEEMATRFAEQYGQLPRLVGQGLSAAEALDYYMVEVGPYNQTEWAEERGVSQQTVSENISKARQKMASQ